MTKADIKTLAKENAFDLIGKQWMLVTAGTRDKFNTMTASWGGIGWLWNKPVLSLEYQSLRNWLSYQFHILCIGSGGSNVDLEKVIRLITK